MQSTIPSPVLWLAVAGVGVLACVWYWLAAYARRWDKETKAIASLENRGGRVYFESFSPWAMSDLTALLTRKRRVQKVWGVEFAGSCDDRTLQDVAAADKLQIALVKITDCQITDAGLASLCRFRHIKHLELSGKQLTDACIGSLVELRGLIGLVLESPQFGNAAIHGIGEYLDVTQLDGLSLAGGRMSDSGLSVLPRIESLSYLHIGCDQVSDNALPYLKQLRGLKAIWLFATGVSHQAAEELAAALPDCEVNWDERCEDG